MTASLAYLLGSSNSLVWSWFFWVYVHPIASIAWFALCLFTLLISVEVHQLQKDTETHLENPMKKKTINDDSKAIDIIVIPPPQLNYSNTKHSQKRNPALAIAQLPNSLD